MVHRISEECKDSGRRLEILKPEEGDREEIFNEIFVWGK